ncbi:flavin reductase family protein [Micromonospora coxensis]|uniref:NADH-FMN oxidoreductase RutF, flavin reductase (DIM6/NTAB) family n=1 Tax=Micromonospora coxensis TaxID=356852 RepID=A0A1C5HCV7_9ACTN|nr:flavin reductase family protein [Micromonospora coxensis]SCG43835.1 NADH-FMN oxidoreductase RutF, flavin reductase (DIM6/NTAB) family [Micromonospora coxensis]
MNVQSESAVEPSDPVQLRRAFGTFATGVTVVTVGGDCPHGMTANSFTSVSLDPPLVLVCVEQQAIMHRSLLERGQFGVSVLAAHQEPVARHFANRRRPLGAAQFDAVDWAPGRVTGAPLITGALAHFECELWRSYEGGDHTIFVGSLLSARREPEADGVLFVHGRFRQLTPDGVDLPGGVPAWHATARGGVTG